LEQLEEVKDGDASNELLFSSSLSTFGVLDAMTQTDNAQLGKIQTDHVESLVAQFGAIFRSNKTFARHLADESLKVLVEAIRMYRVGVEVDVLNEYPLEFANVDTGEYCIYDGEASYEVFCSRFLHPPWHVRVDCLSYMAALSGRTIAAQAANLIADSESAANYIRELEDLDTRLRKVLCGDEFLLAPEVRSYYPREFFWWYYGSPKGVLLAR
jgi:hypothetical protein